MTLGTLRTIMVASGLTLVGGSVVFFITAPAFGFPLYEEDPWRLAQISLPVFMGFLGSAAQFLIAGGKRDREKAQPLLTALVVGPIAIYVIAVVSLLTVYAVTQQGTEGDGMDPDVLSSIYASLLGILTVTASLASGLLFRPTAAGGQP